MAKAVTLDYLATKYPTDKLAAWKGGTGHSYVPWYASEFDAHRLDVRRVLEIGINEGNSLRMWRDYFVNAEIVGLDIHYPGLVTEERIRSYYLDQSSARNLVHFREHCGTFDLIIDDGSHEPEDQKLTCNILGDRLSPGGYYVIEDIRHGYIDSVAGGILWPWERTIVQFDLARKADDVLIVMKRPS
jgi:hypothetical protein